MKVVFHEDFYPVYTSDPASAPGRMESIVSAIDGAVTFVTACPALETDIAAVHTGFHIEMVKQLGLFEIAALSAGGAIFAAEIGLEEPSFGLIRPPGHHASAGSAWGFCYFNNMAVAMESLRRKQKIETAYVLDIDLHYGDGTVNILDKRNYVTVHNMETHDRNAYMDEVSKEMATCRADIIGISAGFDNHIEDWGGLLLTEDYYNIGRLVKDASTRCKGGCFGILEGGYNHSVLGDNVKALIKGLSEDPAPKE